MPTFGTKPSYSENFCTPPPCPTFFHLKDNVTIELLQKTLVETIKAVQNSSAFAGPHAFTTGSCEPSIAETPREKASRPEVKSVVEVWDFKIHGYKLEEPFPTDEVSELEEYTVIE